MEFKYKTKNFLSSSNGEFKKFKFIAEDDYELIFSAEHKVGKRYLFHVMRNFIINELYISSYKVALSDDILRLKYRTYSLNISRDKTQSALNVYMVMFNNVAGFELNITLNGALRQLSKHPPLKNVNGILEKTDDFIDEYNQACKDFNIGRNNSKTLKSYLSLNRVIEDLYVIGSIENMCFLNSIENGESVAIFTSKLKEEANGTLDLRAVCDGVLNSMREALKNGDEKEWIKPYKIAFWPMRAHAGNKLIRDRRSLRNIVLSGKIHDPRWYSTGYIKNHGLKLLKNVAPVIAGHYFSTNEKLIINEKTKKNKLEILDNRVSGGYRTYPFYNAVDIEGILPYKAKAWVGEKEIRIKEFIGKINPNVKHEKASIKAGLAFYDPRVDLIVMPDKLNFVSEYEYFATFLHEIVHWSGHSSRLDRDLNNSTDESYAYEELVAELASSFLMSSLGSDSFRVDNHASYIASWIEQIKNGRIKFEEAVDDAIDAFLYLSQYSSK